jgi:hypothetical protein
MPSPRFSSFLPDLARERYSIQGHGVPQLIWGRDTLIANAPNFEQARHMVALRLLLALALASPMYGRRRMLQVQKDLLPAKRSRATGVSQAHRTARGSCSAAPPSISQNC